MRGHRSFVNAIDFSPDGRIVASASSDGDVVLWWAHDGSMLEPTGRIHAGQTQLWSVHFLSDGKMFATGGNDGTIKLFGNELHNSGIEIGALHARSCGADSSARAAASEYTGLCSYGLFSHGPM